MLLSLNGKCVLLLKSYLKDVERVLVVMNVRIVFENNVDLDFNEELQKNPTKEFKPNDCGTHENRRCYLYSTQF